MLTTLFLENKLQFICNTPLQHDNLHVACYSHHGTCTTTWVNGCVPASFLHKWCTSSTWLQTYSYVYSHHTYISSECPLHALIFKSLVWSLWTNRTTSTFLHPPLPLFYVLMLINISCLSFSLVVGFGMCQKLGFMGIMRNFEDHFGWLNISTLKDIYFSIFHGEVGVDTIFLYNGYVHIVLN